MFVTLLFLSSSVSAQFLAYDDSKIFNRYDRPWLSNHSLMFNDKSPKKYGSASEYSCRVALLSGSDCIMYSRLYKTMWGVATTLTGIATSAAWVGTVPTAGGSAPSAAKLSGLTAASYIAHNSYAERQQKCQSAKDKAEDICYAAFGKDLG